MYLAIIANYKIKIAYRIPVYSFTVQASCTEWSECDLGAVAWIILLLCVIDFLLLVPNSEKMVKIGVYFDIYGSYRKIKTSLFWTTL